MSHPLIMPFRCMPHNPRAAAASGPSLSSANLIAWLPFNGDALDDSGNGHNFTLNGSSPSYISGPTSGQALELNAADGDYASRSDHGDFDCDGAFSIGAWLKSNDLSVDNGFYQKIAGVAGILIQWEPSGNYWKVRVNTANYGAAGDPNADFIGDDSWQHFVFTRASATADILVYRNAGTPVTISMSSATVTPNTNTADIGRYFGTTCELDVCEFFLFKRALSAAEVAVVQGGGSRVTHADITWT